MWFLLEPAEPHLTSQTRWPAVMNLNQRPSERLHREDGFQRVQGAFPGSERLETELHDIRPGPQRDRGTSRDESGNQRYG